jgi:L-aspartate oxidase
MQHLFLLPTSFPLVSAKLKHLPKIKTDILIVGGGIASLRCGIESAKYAKVTILTKGSIIDCNSYLAKGGIASAISKKDSPWNHATDTLKSGCGIADKNIVFETVKEGIEAVDELIKWGIRFDKKRGGFAFAKEGGHSVARILHIMGDQTGMGIHSHLLKIAQKNKKIKIIQDFFAIDLIVDENRCHGVIGISKDARLIAVVAKATVLATGGVCQVYRETTNPITATGDGIAMAYRAGAQIQDIEFIQFHPTVLYMAGAERALISETIRGRGAILRDKYGRRFMKDYHTHGELAPRDIVSRGILNQMIKTNDTQVYLDIRHLKLKECKNEFPSLWALCQKYHINPSKDLIPVRPCAHYTIGGIMIDKNCNTIIENLLACGECACAGFHGANRLGSNSLLECLVFGKRAGIQAAEKLLKPRKSFAFPFKKSVSKGKIDIKDIENSLKSLMWRTAGIIREKTSLQESLEKIFSWARLISEYYTPEQKFFEVQNMLAVSALIIKAALLREESRGTHYRSDFPKEDKNWQKHIILLCKK